eukprot:superscaffoldBa00000373_g4195
MLTGWMQSRLLLGLCYFSEMDFKWFAPSALSFTEVCHSSLVSHLLPSSFRSSSQLSSSHGPGFAKLNRREGAGGWSPHSSDRYQWLEVDLGGRTQITAVATQGRYGSSDWLTAYLLMFSDTGHNWKQYRQEDSIGTENSPYYSDAVTNSFTLKLMRVKTLTARAFPGNSNADSVVQHKLQHPVIARYVRLIPLDWNPNGRIGLRLETYGCLYSRSSSPDGRHLMSLGSLLDDQHWHHVAVEHHSSHLNLTVDKSTLWVQIPSRFTHWDHDQMSVGADQGPGSRRSGDSNRDFHGCMENLVYNNLNLVDLAKQKDQRVTMKSFLWLPGVTELSSTGVSVGLQFRTWNKAGLLLTFDLPEQGGAVWLYLSKARLHLQVHKSGRAPLELSAGSALDDGQWHSVELISRRGRLTVAVDRDEGATAHASPSFLIATEGQLFFGGCPAEGSHQECRNPFKAFQGCMRQLTVDSQPVDLIMVQQRLLGNYSHLQIDMCGIIDRCSASHCEHGGSCSQSWSTFHCNCSSTGYSGATCHSCKSLMLCCAKGHTYGVCGSVCMFALVFPIMRQPAAFKRHVPADVVVAEAIYEQSCEAYKHKGNTSGYYYIDVDGSGPIRPQLIYCNMTEDKTWMVIQHNNTELTRVRPSLDGSLLSWWVGGPGEGQVQTYWGGAPPGTQQCACGLQKNCVDPKHRCNCDADRTEWSLVLGDVQRPDSESAYRVGPLRCHGDKNVWNAAFFDTETSYLHFPTFHGELSADISFLFKTTSSSGVFLENLGIKDFIRIELSSSTEVLFSFDVGNGPLAVHVETGFPLNDNRWHRIRAERNVKEASLRLDELPAATQEAPADGHIHLQLNSQLFIGGTASRQKGFQGCIRALQLNGVTLDLEERAKITPGVQAGCPGHCSSYGSLCQNRGRCVERSNSFSCDCGPSAYTGAFCEREVSASFKPGTSVSYTFKELTLNKSGSAPPPSIYSGMTLRAENISLSFRTSLSPALLLYVGSYYREYLALLLNKHDKLEVRYRLDSSKDVEILSSKVRNLANGQLHTVTISRLADAVSMQIDQNAREDFNLTSDVEFNAIKSLVLGRVSDSGELDPEMTRLATLGFTGCLSAVLFNSISPLKAALLHSDTSPVIITAPLVQSDCGSTSANPYAAETTDHLSGQSGSVGTGQPLVNAIRSDSALIGGVIAVVIFVTVSALAVTGRFLYRRKGTCQSQEVKTVKPEDSPELPFSSQTNSRNGPSENQKEYFI